MIVDPKDGAIISYNSIMAIENDEQTLIYENLDIKFEKLSVPLNLYAVLKENNKGTVLKMTMRENEPTLQWAVEVNFETHFIGRLAPKLRVLGHDPS